MLGEGQRWSGLQTSPYSLGSWGSDWVGQQSLSEVFLLPEKEPKKQKPHKNPRKPESNLVQALENLWHWILRKSSCASGRNLRSGRQGPGSAGPRSCLPGWAPVRAAGGQNCVSGHPVESGNREGTVGQGPPKGHHSPVLCPHRLYLEQVAVAVRPWAKAQEPFSRAQ